MTPPVTTRGKDIRSQALASVTQDMSSSRLRILSDLMESRKRAEQHEQEFLRTIHSENAAFSQIVSLFEETIDDVKSESALVVEKLSYKLEDCGDSIENLRSNLRNEVSQQLENVADEILRVQAGCKDSVESLMQEKEQTRNELERIADLASTSEALRAKQDMESRTMIEGLKAQISLVSGKVDRFEKRLSEIDSAIDEKINGLIERMSQGTRDLESKILERVEESEKRIRNFTDSRLGGALEQVEGQTRELVEEALLKYESEMQSMKKESVTSLSNANDGVSKAIARIDRLEGSLSTYSSVTTEDTRQMIQESLKSLEEKCSTGSFKQSQDLKSSILKILDEQILEASKTLASKIDAQSKIIQAISLAGYRHEWTIQNASSRFKSLGLLASANKYVSSEPFSIGPYLNMQFRLYPVSTQSLDQPTVWLIHRPSSSDSVVPIFVDLAVGLCKRGPLKQKKVQELFGHWVWEAHFPGDILSELDEQGDLRIAVEISMRQWMDLTQLVMKPQENDDQELELPSSPSGMSNYTFGAAPLNPLTTNPFDVAENKGPLTPRRSSWAKFGTSTQSAPELVVYNPFK